MQKHIVYTCLKNFWFTFQVNLFSFFFATSGKNVLDPNESNKNEKCLSVNNFRIMSVVVCGL